MTDIDFNEVTCGEWSIVRQITGLSLREFYDYVTEVASEEWNAEVKAALAYLMFKRGWVEAA